MRTDFLTDDGFRAEETAKGRETMLARPLTNDYTSGREITDRENTNAMSLLNYLNLWQLLIRKSSVDARSHRQRTKRDLFGYILQIEWNSVAKTVCTEVTPSNGLQAVGQNCNSRSWRYCRAEVLSHPILGITVKTNNEHKSERGKTNRLNTQEAN